jgi:hypothetical protein
VEQIDASQARVADYIFLSHVHVLRNLELSKAEIGSVLLESSTFESIAGLDVVARDMCVLHSVDVRKAMDLRNGKFLSMQTIDTRFGTFHSDSRVVVDERNLTIEKNYRMSSSTVNGGLDMSDSTKIRGSLLIEDSAMFPNGDDLALIATGIAVAKIVRLIRMKTYGIVDFAKADIGDSLQMNDSSVRCSPKPVRCGFSAKDSSIFRDFHWNRVSFAPGARLDLSAATLGSIWIDGPGGLRPNNLFIGELRY